MKSGRNRRVEITVGLVLFSVVVGCVRSKETVSSLKTASDLKPAPTVNFETLDGRTVTLAGYRGKVVLLNFWGTWCGVCQSEIPELIRLQQEYGNKRFTVLGVAMEDTKSAVASYIVKPQFDIGGTKVAMNYPVVLGNDKVATKFGGFLGYPDSFIISKDGKLVAKIVGTIDTQVAGRVIRGLL